MKISEEIWFGRCSRVTIQTTVDVWAHVQNSEQWFLLQALIARLEHERDERKPSTS